MDADWHGCPNYLAPVPCHCWRCEEREEREWHEAKKMHDAIEAERAEAKRLNTKRKNDRARAKLKGRRNELARQTQDDPRA